MGDGVQSFTSIVFSHSSKYIILCSDSKTNDVLSQKELKADRNIYLYRGNIIDFWAVYLLFTGFMWYICCYLLCAEWLYTGRVLVYISGLRDCVYAIGPSSHNKKNFHSCKLHKIIINGTIPVPRCLC